MRTQSRRLARFGALSVVAALALGGPLAGAAFAGGNQDPETLATLHIEKDNVEVRKAGKDAFKEAKDEQKLEEGDTVRTDATGRAEVQYDDQSYTFLDVGTTFTIVQLTDDQGNRQVEGSLDTGRTWNRAEGLTESESFEQSGAGATAAVQGTAFAIQCVSADDCDYVGAVDDTTLTGANEGQTLLTLDLCKALSGDLCDQLSKLGPGDLFDFMQEMLIRDLLVHGLGPGTFNVSVQGGQLVVTQVTEAGSTSTTPPADVPPAIGDPPILCDQGCDVIGAEAIATPGDFIDTGDNSPVQFRVQVVNPSGVHYFIVFTVLPNDPSGDDAGVVSYCNVSCEDVNVGQRYDQTIPDSYFLFTPTDLPTEGEAQGNMTFHTETDAGAQSESRTVPVTVNDEGEGCDCS